MEATPAAVHGPSDGSPRKGPVKPESGSLPLLRTLHERVFAAEDVRAVLGAAFEELTAELRDRPDPPHATCVIPVGLFVDGVPGRWSQLPDGGHPVRLCRAFLLCRGARMATPERHRNSVQRLVSYRGRGRIHQGVAGGGPLELRPRELRSPGGEEAGLAGWSGSSGPWLPAPSSSESPVFPAAARFWDIVPPGVWHFPEAGGDEDWATVTFHSAAEDEIIDELWEG